MSAPVLVLAIMAYAIVGMIVVESCRIWRTWWLTMSFWTVALWPFVLIWTILYRIES